MLSGGGVVSEASPESALRLSRPPLDSARPIFGGGWDAEPRRLYEKRRRHPGELRPAVIPEHDSSVSESIFDHRDEDSIADAAQFEQEKNGYRTTSLQQV